MELVFLGGHFRLFIASPRPFRTSWPAGFSLPSGPQTATFASGLVNALIFSIFHPCLFVPSSPLDPIFFDFHLYLSPLVESE